MIVFGRFLQNGCSKSKPSRAGTEALSEVHGVANCREQYIGQTHRSLKERFSEHLRYVDKNSEATGKHFKLPGHSKSDMSVTILEKVHRRDVWVREEKESEFIRNFKSFYKGIKQTLVTNANKFMLVIWVSKTPVSFLYYFFQHIYSYVFVIFVNC